MQQAQKNTSFKLILSFYFCIYFCLGTIPANIDTLMLDFSDFVQFGIGIMLVSTLITSTISMLVFGYFSEYLAERFTRKKLFLTSNLLWIIPYGLLPFSPNYTFFLILVIFGAVGNGSFLPIGFSIIGDLYEPEQRGVKFGSMMVGQFLGNGVGILIGGALGWRISFAIGSVLGLLTFFGFIYYGTESLQEERHGNLSEKNRYKISFNDIRELAKTKTVVGILMEIETEEEKIINKDEIKMVLEKEEVPLIKFEDNVSAPLLRYDLPSPSSYEGRNYIELDVPVTYFNDEYILDPPELVEYFEVLLKDFLITNEEIIREYIQSISIEELEQQLFFFSLAQNESTQEEIAQKISRDKIEIQERISALENVALTGTPSASSCLGGTSRHKISHLNDGLYGNNRSWVSNDTDAWAKIELPEPRVIVKVVFARDNAGGASDRYPGNVDVYYSDDDVNYSMVTNQVKLLQGTETIFDGHLSAGQNAEYTFTPFMAKYIKLYKVRKGGCIDEIEIYSPSTYGIAFEKLAGDMELKFLMFKYYVQLSLDYEKRIPFFYKTMGGKYKLRIIKCPDFKPRLMFVETYRLTSFPGDYGAGKTIKTLSLLPKEETEISIKTWKKTIATTKEASSILDSYTEDKADEFEDSVQNESSKKHKIDESVAYHVEASAKTTFGTSPPPGLGGPKSDTELSINAGVKGSTNSSREAMSRNVMNATEKHAQKSSAKREVNIDTSYERTEDMGEEVVITRRIENLNASRTLNFTFRQMNQ